MISKKEKTRQMELRTEAWDKWEQVSTKLVNVMYLIETKCGYCTLIEKCHICPMKKEGVCGGIPANLVPEIFRTVDKANEMAKRIGDIIRRDIIKYEIQYEKAQRSKNGKRKKGSKKV